MTAPRRLIEADDEFERDLIHSAHGDRPSDRALERMLLGLGVNLSQLPPAIASAAPGAATSGKIGSALLTKWLVTGMAIGLTTAGGAQLVGRLLEHPSPRAAEVPGSFTGPPPSLAVSRPISPSPRREAMLATARTSPSTLVPSARARIAPTPVAPPVASEPNPGALAPERPALGSFALEAAPAPPATLTEEMRLLDAARRALASGDAHLALSNLASYEGAFPSGALRPEAAVLKVRALLAAGDRASAEALGHRIVEGAPRSEHADAVRAALGVRTNP